MPWKPRRSASRAVSIMARRLVGVAMTHMAGSCKGTVFLRDGERSAKREIECDVVGWTCVDDIIYPGAEWLFDPPGIAAAARRPDLGCRLRHQPEADHDEMVVERICHS